MKTLASKRLLVEQGIAGELAEVRAKWPMLQQVPVPMTVKIPLPGISLRGLASLSAGDLIVSSWVASEEVPLYASNIALSWGEFEVVDGMIAIRLTRLG